VLVSHRADDHEDPDAVVELGGHPAVAVYGG